MTKIGQLLLGAVLLVGLAGAGSAAEIQCKRILKYLDTGRSVSDVAETMVISEDDVLACKEQAEAAKKGEGDDAKADEGAETK